MSLPTSNELAKVLLKRHDCLQAIVEQPRAKRELVDSLDIPRSTLDDVVRELERASLVEYRDGQWHPTTPGRSAYHVHRNYVNQLDSLREASSVLKAVDTDNEISWTFIDGADVYETHPNVPDAVMTVLLEYVEAATDVRVLTPQMVAGYGDELYRSGTSGAGATIEIIVPMEVHEWFRSMQPRIASQPLEDPDVNALHASVPFSFGLSIFDSDRAGLTVFTDQGIAGLLVNDGDEAVRWAEKQYERVKQDASPVSRREDCQSKPTNS